MTLLVRARAAAWQALAFMGLGTNASCRMVQCLPRDPSASSIAAVSVESVPSLVVRGRVVSIETGQPLTSARVRIVTPASVWQPVDREGRVELAMPGPGAYTVEVMAPEHDLVSRAVVVRDDVGVAWVAAMARSRPMIRDHGCVGDSTSVTQQL